MPLSSSISLCNSCDTTFTQSRLIPTAERSAQLLQILRTNCAHRETSGIRAAISAVPAELARYDEELARLDCIFEKIVAGRAALQQHYDQCVAVIDAPVRRLPNEMLLEIFNLCGQPTQELSMDPVAPQSWEYEAQKEVRRVAGGHLFPLSQVCTQWRELVTGTPTLWSTINLDLRCWTIPVETMRASYLHQQMVQFLKVALERGRQTLLTIEVYGVGECHPHALQTIALAGHRWRSASFTLDCGMLKNLSAVTGNLPILETLCIHVLKENSEALSDVARYFSDAPQLRTVEFCGPLAPVARLPLEQLHHCAYRGVEPEDLPSLLSQFTQLSSAQEVLAQINLEAVRAALPLELPSVVSQIEELVIDSVQDNGDDSFHALAAIFGALTLPRMQGLRLLSMPNTEQPLYWPQPAAHALFVRSASRHTLQALSLNDVAITESDLLDTLAELPSLLYLFISDHPALAAVDGNPAHHLITDSLLKKLTPEGDPEKGRPKTWLVPNLEIVDLRTLGQFRDELLLNFIGNRALHHTSVGSFECALLWLPGYCRQLTDATTDLLTGWVEIKELLFTCREYDPNEDQ
ncbi:hypothetical protein C8R44DRAFT_864570 [Mycena epipterygia]|nr:hypothetical protein C8R44DRAFT_864570 [Mycena epipterygia]